MAAGHDLDGTVGRYLRYTAVTLWIKPSIQICKGKIYSSSIIRARRVGNLPPTPWAQHASPCLAAWAAGLGPGTHCHCSALPVSAGGRKQHTSPYAWYLVRNLKAAASPAHHGAPRGLHLTPRRYLQPNTRVLAWPLGLLDFEQHITERACSHASQRWRHGRGAAGLPWAHRPNGLRPAGSKRCNSLPWKLPGRGAKMGENTNCLARVVSTK